MPKINHPSGIPLSELAQKVGGLIHGDAEVNIFDLCPLDDTETGSLTFSTSTRPDRLLRQISDIAASAVLVQPSAVPTAYNGIPTLVAVPDPFRALLMLVPYFFKPLSPQPGISPLADISPTASLGQGTTVGPFSVIGDETILEESVTVHAHVVLYPHVHVGRGAILHAGAIIREGVTIGPGVIIQNGAVIGADGFGYVPDGSGVLQAVPQIGTVQIEQGVDIGANTCIDRGTLGATRIGMGTKIDNLVQIGHNVRLGNSVIVCGQAGIAGSAELGDRVVVGGAAGIGDHLRIAAGSRLSGRTGVTSHLDEPGDYAGHPAMPASLWRRVSACIPKLPDLLRTNKAHTANSLITPTIKERK